MDARLDYRKLQPELAAAMVELSRRASQSGLEPALLELVRLRASQINGCAFCVDMHTKDARVAGESEQRLYAVAVWEEAPFFTARERAALRWTEAVTLLSVDHVPDHVYDQVREFFSEAETVALTWAIIAINGWNRIALACRTPAGSYQPAPAGHRS
jgi:AhpD family alkylhydroperoxidase